ncbi:general secretion pathway protein GspB [Pseudomonas sp. HK3]
MSYLLKALEKAEQERQQNVSAEQGEPVIRQHKASLPMGLVVVVVLILLLTLWQAWPSKESALSDGDMQINSEFQSQESVSRESIFNESASTELDEEKNTDPTSQANNGVSQMPVQPMAPPKPKDLSQLTTNELAMIPSLNLASHIYSSAPDYRSVVINDQTYKEGALIQAGLKLEEINQSGIIINIHGQRVELPKGISWVASKHAK